VLDKKKVGKGTNTSIITDIMKSVLRQKDEENRAVAVRFGDSIISSDLNQARDNIKMMNKHEKRFIRSSIERGYFNNYGTKDTYKIKPNNKTVGSRDRNDMHNPHINISKLKDNNNNFTKNDSKASLLNDKYGSSTLTKASTKDLNRSVIKDSQSMSVNKSNQVSYDNLNQSHSLTSKPSLLSPVK